MKILIADNNEDPRIALCRVLEAEDHTVEIAINGIHALDMARHSTPDLIISDIMMPGIDGFAFCHAAKSDVQLKQIPFIFYTATYTDPLDEQLALDLGAYRFIHKPVNGMQILEIIAEAHADYKEGRLAISDKPLNNTRDPDKSYMLRLTNKLNKKVQELEREHAALEENKARYQTLTVRLQEVEDKERKKLSNELHDRAGQTLSGVHLNLSIIRRLLSAESLEKVGFHINDAMSLVEETTTCIHNIMAKLRPDILDYYGLIEALRWYCNQFSQRTGVAVEVVGDEASPRIPKNVESVLFRISQEALTNIAKHAGASQVSVTINKKTNLFSMTITDNGKGFDVTAPHKLNINSVWGLRIMQERVQSVGGKFNIESELGKGTKITVDVKNIMPKKYPIY